MDYFNKAHFERDFIDYCKRPTMAKMERLVADHIIPICRGYAAGDYIKFVYADREEAIHVAAIKCWEKLLHFRRITSPKGKLGSALAYFDRITYHAMLGFEVTERERLSKLASIDA